MISDLFFLDIARMVLHIYLSSTGELWSSATSRADLVMALYHRPLSAISRYKHDKAIVSLLRPSHRTFMGSGLNGRVWN